MDLRHEPADGSPRTLASDVETATTLLQRARGLMFRRSIPDDHALVFRFGRPGTRRLHMLFVPFPVDAVWLRDDEVVEVARLRPWLGTGAARADTVVELPAGAADDVRVGDVVRVVASDGSMG